MHATVGMAAPMEGSETPTIVRRARRGSVTLHEQPPAWIKAQQAKHRAVVEAASRHADEDDDDAAGWNWVRDAHEGYVAAQRQSDRGGRILYRVRESHEVREVLPADVAAPILAPSSLRKHYEDMVRMEEVNEPSVLHNIRLRFSLQEIYTNIGSILVSVNPFEFLDWLYDPSMINTFASARAGEETPPHVFAIAANAFRGMSEDSIPQSVVISGESGAGKTEATKKCLQYLAEVAGSAETGLDERLLAANPILEAFGNAKTARNNNSSRFGKWMVVRFGKPHGAPAGSDLSIVGCHIVNYLLERSRLVAPGVQERTYHIFYQMCEGMDSASRGAMRLRPAAECALLTKPRTSLTVSSIDDRGDWSDTQRAFGVLGFTEDEVSSVLQCVAAVLHLADVQFEGDERAVVPSANQPCLEAAALMLGVSPEDLEVELTRRERSAGVGIKRDVSFTSLGAGAASDSRWALITALYSKLFDWLVHRINKALAGSEGGEEETDEFGPSAAIKSAQSIGILDIFGFEIFEHNSLEQLCINFCNEKLQQLFNNHVFKEEQRVYDAEGIDASDVRFIDNQNVLDLIEGRDPSGLLVRLDDMTISMLGTDGQYVRAVAKDHMSSEPFIEVSHARARQLGMTHSSLPFGVRHYAGEVVYDAVGFLDKNKDQLMPNVASLMTRSTTELIASDLFGVPAEDGSSTPVAAASSSSRTPRKKKANPTQSAKFRGQLTALMETLQLTQPHYIRCIKPNSEKKPRLFEGQLSLQQLRYSGVFDAVRIRQEGFPFRWKYQEFVARYRCCTDISEAESQSMLETEGIDTKLTPNWARRRGPRPWPVEHYMTLARTIVSQLIDELGPSGGCFTRDLRFGRTMLLYRAEVHRRLTTLRASKTNQAAKRIQRMLHCRHARLVAWRLRASRMELAWACARKSLADMETAVRNAMLLAANGDVSPTDGSVSLPAPLRDLPIPTGTPKCPPGMVPAVAMADWSVPDWPWDEDSSPRPPVPSAWARIGPVTSPLGPVPEFAAASAQAHRLREETDAKEALVRALEDCGVARDLELVREAVPALEGAVAEADRLSLTDLTELAEATALVEAVRKWEQARLDLTHAVEGYDRRGIEGARRVAFALKTQFPEAVGWASLGETLEEQATSAIQEIEAEEEALQELQEAISLGALTTTAALALADGDIRASGLLGPRTLEEGGTSVLPSSSAHRGRVSVSVRWDHLAAPAEALSDTQLRTPDGKSLLILSSLLTTLRGAVAGGSTADGNVDWALVDEAVEAFKSLPSIPPAAETELQAAVAAASARSAARRIRASLLRGQPAGPPGDMYADSLEIGGLQSAIDDLVSTSEAASGPLAVPSVQVLFSTAQFILSCRQAAAGENWEELEALLADTERSENVAAVASEEVFRYLAEVRERRAERRLAQALKHGALKGRVGQLDTSEIEIEGLENAVARSAGASGARARRLHDAAALVILPLRRCALAGDWDGASRIAATVSEDEIPDECAEEVALAVAQAEERAVISELKHGLETGKVRPVVEGSREVDLSAIETGPIMSSLRASGAFECRTEESQVLRLAAEAAAEWRFAALQGQWDLAAKFARELGDKMSDWGASATSDDPDKLVFARLTDLPPAVEEERFLVLAESQRQDIISSLRDAMRRSNLGESVDVGALGRAVAAASGLDYVGSADDVLLVETAELVSKVRTSLSRNNWVEACQALIDATASWRQHSSSPLKGETTDSFATALAIASGSVSGIDFTEAGHLCHEDGLGELTDAVLSIRALAASDALTHSLAQHRVRGRADALWIDVGEVHPLERAVAAARMLPVESRTAHVRALESTAALIGDARKALKAWASVVSVGHFAPKAVKFVDRSALEDPLKIMAPLTFLKSVAEPSASFATVHLPTAALACGIDAEACSASGVTATQAAEEGDAWSSVAAAAGALARRFGVASDALDESTGPELMGSEATDESAMLNPETRRVARREALLVQDAVDNRRLVTAIRSALRRGRASGAPGAIRILEIETGALSRALGLAAELGERTPEAENLVWTARIVLRARRALRDGDIVTVQTVCEEAQAGDSVAPDASEELQLCAKDASHRAVMAQLTSAISTGGLQGPVGKVDASRISTEALEAAVAQASKAFGASSSTAAAATGLPPAAVRLLESARMVLRVRQLVRDGKWEGAEGIVEELALFEAQPEGESGPTSRVWAPDIAPSARAELELVRSETAHRRVCSDLSSALCTGGPIGDTSSFDSSVVRVDVLARAIELAHQVGCRSSRSRALATAARVIRAVRAAALAGDWGGAVEELAATDGEHLLDGSLEEDALEGTSSPDSDDVAEQPGSVGQAVTALRAAQSEARLVSTVAKNRLAKNELLSALATGGCTMESKQLDVSCIETERLERALERVARLGLEFPEPLQEPLSAFMFKAAAPPSPGGSATPLVSSLAIVAVNVLHLRTAFSGGSRDEAEQALDRLRSVPGVTEAMAVVSSATSPDGTADEEDALRGSPDRLPAEWFDDVSGSLPKRCAQELFFADREVRAVTASAALVTALNGPGAATGRALRSLALEAASLSAETVVPDPEMALVRSAVADATGEELSSSGVSSARLRDAIAVAQVTGTPTSEAKQLLRAAQALAAVRDAALAGDWEGVWRETSRRGLWESVLVHEAIPQCVRDELAAVKSVAATLRVAVALRRAMRHFPVKGVDGSLDLSDTSVQELDKALGMLDDVGLAAGKGGSLEALARAARMVRRLRAALLASDLPRAEACIDEAVVLSSRIVSGEEGSVFVQEAEESAQEARFRAAVGPVAAREFAIAEAAIAASGLDSQLERAMKIGAVSGVPGLVAPVSSVSTDVLERAVAALEESHVRSSHSLLLDMSARAIVSVRGAVRRGEWGEAGELAREALAHGVHPSAKKELALVVAEAADQQACQLLIDAMLSGTAVAVAAVAVEEDASPVLARSVVLGLSSTRLSQESQTHSVTVQRPPILADLSKVDSTRLSEAVRSASRLGCRTMRSRRLLASAQFLVRLRALALSGDWDTVMSAVHALRMGGGLVEALRVARGETTLAEDPSGEIPSGLAPEAEAEVALLGREAKDQWVCERLSSGVSSGGIVGSPDDFIPSRVDPEPVVAAVTFAADQGCASGSSQALLGLCQTLRRLRVAVASMDWGAIPGAVDAVKQRVEAALNVAKVATGSSGVDLLASSGVWAGSLGMMGTRLVTACRAAMKEATDAWIATETRTLVRQACACLTSGGASGKSFGTRELLSAETGPLESFLQSLASERNPSGLKAHVPEASVLTEVARKVLEMRQLQRGHDVQGAGATASALLESGLLDSAVVPHPMDSKSLSLVGGDAASERPLLSVLRPTIARALGAAQVEALAARSDSVVQSCEAHLQEALLTGCLRGAPGRLDLAAVSAAPLLSAVRQAEALPGGVPSVFGQLVRVAGAVARLRTDVVAGNWGHFGESIHAAKDSLVKGSFSATVLSSVAKELSVAEREHADRSVREALSEALSDSSKTIVALETVSETDDGDTAGLHLPPSSDTVQLAAALSEYSELVNEGEGSRVSLQTEALARAATALLALRRAASAKDWIRLRSFVAALDQISASRVSTPVEHPSGPEAPPSSSEVRLALSHKGDSTPPPGLEGLWGAGPHAATPVSEGEGALANAARTELEDRAGYELRRWRVFLREDDAINALVNCLRAGHRLLGQSDSSLVALAEAAQEAVDATRAAVARVEALGPRGKRATSLLHLARKVQSLRLAFVSEDWQRAVEHAMELRDEVDAFSTTLVGSSSAKTLTVLSRSSESNPLVSAVTCLSQEVDLLRIHSAAEQHVRELERGMKQHRLSLSGVDGSLTVDSGSFALLDEALRRVTDSIPRAQDRPLRLRTSMAVAALLRDLRAAAERSDWEGLSIAVEAASELSGASVGEEAQGEIKAAMAAMHTRSVTAGPLMDALASGGPQGPIGDMNTGALDVQALDHGLEHATRVGCETPAARRLVRTAVAIRRVRAAARAGDWSAVAELVKDAESVELVGGGSREIRRFRFEVAARDAEAALAKTLVRGSGVEWFSMGGPREPVRANTAARLIASGRGRELRSVIDRSRVDVDSLEAVIESVETQARSMAHEEDEATWSIMTPGVTLLLRTARTILSLRSALLRSDLDKVVSTLDEVRRSRLADVVQPELIAMLSEFDDRSVQTEICNALTRGGATGSPGQLDVGSIELAALDAALEFASKVERVSDETRNFLAAAEIVRSLRAGLSVPGVDWSLVRSGLEAAEAVELIPEAVDEVNLVRADVIVRGVAQELTESFRSRGVVCSLVKAPQMGIDLASGKLYSLGSSVSSESSLRDALEAMALNPVAITSALRGGSASLTTSAATVSQIQAALEGADEVIHDPTVLQVTGGSSAADGALSVLPDDFQRLVKVGRALFDVRRHCVTEEWDRVEGAIALFAGEEQSTHALFVRAQTEARENPLASGSELLFDWEEATDRVRRALDGSAGGPTRAITELAAVWTALDMRRQRQLRAARVEGAVRRGDEELATRVLESALEFGCEDPPSSGVPDDVAGRIRSCKASYLTFVQMAAHLKEVSSRYDADAIRSALREAHKHGMVGTAVANAETRLRNLGEAVERANEALQRVDDVAMSQALSAAESGAVPLPEALVSELRATLSLPPRRRLERRLHAALGRRDGRVAVQCTLELKRLLLSGSDSDQDSLPWERGRSIEHFRGMRRPKDFAVAMRARREAISGSPQPEDWPSVAEAQACLTRWTGETLPTSVTVLPRAEVKLAVALSRNILSMAGEYGKGHTKLHSSSAGAMSEILALAYMRPELRDEIIAQTLRHLTANPSASSERIGWGLLWLCISSFSPSELFENTLELWLRSHLTEGGLDVASLVTDEGAQSPWDTSTSGHGTTGASRACLLALHRSAFYGGLASAMPEQDIAARVRRFFDDRKWDIPDSALLDADTTESKDDAAAASVAPAALEEAVAASRAATPPPLARPPPARAAAPPPISDSMLRSPLGSSAMSLSELQSRASRIHRD
jgi:hypothetical protein